MGKREPINTGIDTRDVRRDKQGQFKEEDDVGRANATDPRHDAQPEST